MRKTKGEYFSIRQVIELTGVSEFTLRGWETRYQAFTPKRTETGRRLYSIFDIKKARLLQELTAKGHRIKDIASMSLEELETYAPTHEIPKTRERSKDIGQIIDLANQFEWDDLRDLLNKKRKALKANVFVAELLMPVLAEMSGLVGENLFSIAQEHILSALIKEQLICLKSESKKPRSESRLVITTPDGDLHDIGIMISASLAAHSGVHTLFLGPSTPKKELCETCIRYGATHLLVSSTISETEGAKESLYSYINFLDRNLPKGISLLIAGRNTFGFHAKLNRNWLVLNSISEYEDVLGSLS